MWEDGGVDPLDLLLHPVRLRIVYAMSGGRVRSTTELCASLADVPKTAVYRHVGLLAEGGILEVAGEQRVRGAVERHYRLRRDGTTVDDAAAASMSLDDHRHGFATAVAALHAEFNAYLDRPGADPTADRIGYRQGVVWLTDAEATELLDDLRATFATRATHSPAPGRSPRLFSLIQFPADDPDRLRQS